MDAYLLLFFFLGGGGKGGGWREENCFPVVSSCSDFVVLFCVVFLWSVSALSRS